MVIFNHTHESGYLRFATTDVHTLEWVWVTFLSAACKAGIPIFFMISGANLIGKCESFAKTFSRTRRIFVCLCFWSLLSLYLAYPDFSFIEAFKRIVREPYWHLWFLYAYLVFLFALPLIRKLGQNIEKGEFYLLIVICMIFSIFLPMIDTFIIKVWADWKPNWIMSNIFIYPIIGYYIENKINQITGRKLIFIWIFNIIIFLLSEVCAYKFLEINPGDKNEEFLLTTTLLNSVSLFITAKYFFCKMNLNILKKFVLQTGNLIFGIYFLHLLLLWKIVEYLGEINVYFLVILTFISSAAIVYVLKRIPIIRYLL